LVPITHSGRIMQLTGPECCRRSIIQNHDPRSARIGSYDLQVDKVVASGKEYTRPFSVKPQQMFILVSKETVTVPPGYALPKTSLCQQGILPLSTGILD